LRGRCRGCRKPIGWVYPTVELITAVCLLLLYGKYGFTAPFFLNGLFFCLLIILTFVDVFERILPDVITLGGTVTGFLLAPVQSAEYLRGGTSFFLYSGVASSYLNAFLGIVFGGGFLWLVATLYLKLRKIEGMGFGDVKMMAMVGAFLGWQYAWLTILVGSLIGAVVGGLFIFLSGRGRMYELPFGSFLGLGAVLVTLYGSRLLNWYLNQICLAVF
jgi:leader peptidase (prepilin peptidase)/N-methyltransferase